jgi:hypothetical protein
MRFKRLLFAAKRAEQIVDTDGGLNARVRDVSACINGAGNPRVFACAHRYFLNIHPTECWDHRNIYSRYLHNYDFGDYGFAQDFQGELGSSGFVLVFGGFLFLVCY